MSAPRRRGAGTITWRTRWVCAPTFMLLGLLLATPTAGLANAGQPLEQTGTYLDSCSFHYGQLESDARQAARDYCGDLGGIRSIDDFEHREEIVRENEFSKKYRCTVTSRVACYAAE